ncbi:MAG: ChbG/HpnK family deacetylase [Alphaproteobacteria bacterium]|nr:MAG: ChbG/HpnK family deacetylase [Alphaproteobacteria bacterium]
MKKLIINADDFGLTDGVCRGIVELLELGAIRDTTAMMAVEGSVTRALAHGAREMGAVMGLHLQLTSGVPLCAAEDVPSLVRPDGRFKDKLELGGVDPAQVRLEWERQVDVFVDSFGFLPTHLDSHHSVHDVGELAEIYLELAVLMGIPVRRGHVRALEGQRQEFGVQGTDAVVNAWTGRGLGVGALKTQIVAAADGYDVVEVVAHPGYSDERLREVSSLNDRREADLQDLRALHAEGWVAANGFILASYGDAF